MSLNPKQQAGFSFNEPRADVYVVVWSEVYCTSNSLCARESLPV